MNVLGLFLTSTLVSGNLAVVGLDHGEVNANVNFALMPSNYNGIPGQDAPSPIETRISSNSMDAQGERDLMDHKVEAAEARTDTKFARLEGKMDLVLSEVRDTRSEGKSNRNIIVTTMIASVLSISALMYALVSVASASWYNGTVIFDHFKAAQTPASPSK